MVDWKDQLLADVTVEAKAEKMDRSWVESWVEWSVIVKVGRLVASMDESMVERSDIEMVVTSVGRKGYSEAAASDDRTE